MRAAVKVPSGFLVAAAAATATPDLSSLLLATSKRVTGTLGPTMIFFSPSRYFTVRTGPSTLLTVWPTAPLVIVPLGAPGHPADVRRRCRACSRGRCAARLPSGYRRAPEPRRRSEEHTSELQSPDHLVCRLLLEKKKISLPLNRPCSSRRSPRSNSTTPPRP